MHVQFHINDNKKKRKKQETIKIEMFMRKDKETQQL
jgi:hypothetical protein